MSLFCDASRYFSIAFSLKESWCEIHSLASPVVLESSHEELARESEGIKNKSMQKIKYFI